MSTAGHSEVTELVKDLRRQASALEVDLTQRAAEPEFASRLRAEYDRRPHAKRTASGYTAWLEGRVGQAAAAWVLATVFVRYCEDNELIEWPFIAGPGERLIDAEERHEAYFRENPTAERPGLAARRVRPSRGHQRDRGRAVRPAAQPAVGHHPVVRGGRCAAGVLAASRPGRRNPLARRRLGHPVPRRRLPGPVRARPQDVRAAADPGVRRGVHPRPHAGRRRSRSSGSTACAPSTRPAAPGTSCSALFHRILEQWRQTAPGARRLGADPPVASTRCTVSTRTRSRCPSPGSGCWSPCSRSRASSDSTRPRCSRSTSPSATR